MPRRPPPIAACLALAWDVGATLRGRDLAAVAAGLTYFAALGVVPWLLLAVWGAARVTARSQPISLTYR